MDVAQTATCCIKDRNYDNGTTFCSRVSFQVGNWAVLRCLKFVRTWMKQKRLAALFRQDVAPKCNPKHPLKRTNRSNLHAPADRGGGWADRVLDFRWWMREPWWDWQCFDSNKVAELWYGLSMFKFKLVACACQEPLGCRWMTYRIISLISLFCQLLRWFYWEAFEIGRPFARASGDKLKHLPPAPSTCFFSRSSLCLFCESFSGKYMGECKVEV